MSNSKENSAPTLVQMELPWSKLPSQKHRAGSYRYYEAVCEALKSALSDCGLGRDTVSEELGRLVGEKITVNHINNWTAESKNGWRLPLEYAAALSLITQDTGIIKAALTGTGLSIMNEQERDYYELGKITAESRIKSKKKKNIFGRLGI